MSKITAFNILAALAGLSAGTTIVTPVRAAPYAKVCNNGAVAGTPALCPANPVLGTRPTDWGCTLDRGTQLLWEVKVISGLRSYRSILANYDLAGTVQTALNNPISLALLDASDNGLGYAKAVNATSYCGRTAWLRPTQTQLQSLVVGGAQPGFDRAFFIDLTFRNAVRPQLPTLSSTPSVTAPSRYEGVYSDTGRSVTGQRAGGGSYVRVVTFWNNGIPCGGIEQVRCPGSQEGGGGSGG